MFSPSPVAVYTAVTDEMIWRDEIIWSGKNSFQMSHSAHVEETSTTMHNVILIRGKVGVELRVDADKWCNSHKAV